MHQLMRRVALGLTLPLVVGAPVLLLAGPAHAAGTPTDVTLTSPSDAIVYGQEVQGRPSRRGRRHDRAADQPRCGRLQFRADAVARWVMLQRIPVDAAGHATTPLLTVQARRPATRRDHRARPWTSATYPGSVLPDHLDGSPDAYDSAWSCSASTQAASIGRGPAHGHHAGRRRDRRLPRRSCRPTALKPGGAVDFKVDGAVVGSNDVDPNGNATLNHVLPRGTADGDRDVHRRRSLHRHL